MQKHRLNYFPSFDTYTKKTWVQNLGWDKSRSKHPLVGNSVDFQSSFADMSIPYRSCSRSQYVNLGHFPARVALSGLLVELHCLGSRTLFELLVSGLFFRIVWATSFSYLECVRSLEEKSLDASLPMSAAIFFVFRFPNY